MTAVLITAGRLSLHDDDGEPLVGAKCFTYLTGTSTPVATYTSVLLAVQNANPLIADSNGTFPVIYANSALGPVKLRFQTAAGVDLPGQDVDPYPMPEAAPSYVPYPPTDGEDSAGIAPVSTGYASSEGSTLNVWRFFTAAQIASCIAEDGLVDMKPAIQAANDFLEGRSTEDAGGAPHPGGTLFFPGGVYNITGPLRVGGNVRWRGDHLQSTVLSWSSTSDTGVCIALGPDASGFFGYSGTYTMGSSIESMRISLDPQNQFSVAINTVGAHQGSHLLDLKIEGVNQKGIALGNTGGPAYFWMRDINIQGGTRDSLPTAREGIYAQMGAIVEVDTLTVEGAGGHNFSICVRMHDGSLQARDLHFENATTGVYFDPGGTNATSVINGISGNSSVTQLIWIPAGYKGTVTALGINGLSGDPAHPIAVKNENTGEVALNTMVGVYSWSGDASSYQTGAYGYSLLHNHLSSHVRYGKSAAQAITQNTVTLLSFPTKLDDPFSEWNGSRFTPVVPGRYRVTLSVLMASAAWTSTAAFRLYISKNGATFSTFESPGQASSTIARQFQHVDTVNLGVGDYLEANVYQGAVSSLNTDSSAITCYIAIDRMT